MKCPGQDTQYWNASAIYEVDCPQCNRAVEFFKDDTARRCPHCGHRFANPRMDFGCAAYCRFAEQCLGTLPAELTARRHDLFKDRVALAVKRHLGTDFKRIGRTLRTARQVETIGRQTGQDLSVLLPAAYLHDLGTAAARRMLSGVGAPDGLIDAVCRLIETAATGTAPEAELLRRAAAAADTDPPDKQL